MAIQLTESPFNGRTIKISLRTRKHSFYLFLSIWIPCIASATSDGGALMISWRRWDVFKYIFHWNCAPVWLCHSELDITLATIIFIEHHYRVIEVECILFEELFSHVETNSILIFTHPCSILDITCMQLHHLPFQFWNILCVCASVRIVSEINQPWMKWKCVKRNWAFFFI